MEACVEKNDQTKKEASLAESTSYEIESRIFVVEPFFPTGSHETLGDVLLRLMKSELTKS